MVILYNNGVYTDFFQEGRILDLKNKSPTISYTNATL